MMNNKKNHILIERYLNGEMNAIEQYEFEIRIINDIELHNDMILYTEMSQSIEETAFRNKLEQTTYEYLKNDYPKDEFKRKLFTTIAISGPVFAACVLAWLFFLNKNISDELYDNYFSPYPVISRVRLAEASSVTFQKAADAYENNRYNEAADYFICAEKLNPTDIETTFYAGISYMEIKNYTQAGACFDKLIKGKQNRLMPLCNWYRALIYMKQNNKTEAKKLFREIIKLNNEKSIMANEILVKIAD